MNTHRRSSPRIKRIKGSQSVIVTSKTALEEEEDLVIQEAPSSLKSEEHDDDNQNKEGDLKLLKEWISHNDATYHHFQPEEAAKIRQALLDWYRANRRKLPWRGDAPPYDGSTAAQSKPSSATTTTTNDNDTAQEPTLPVSAYGIWISEIMCQQTRVAAVVPYWLRWMESFPTVQALADATEEQVNSHWAGLGFYRRARLLHQASKFLVEKHDGELPPTVEGLLEIPGVGRYTASAIASIAFGVCAPVVDGNVCRVLARLKGICQHIKAPVLKDKLGWDLAQQIVQAGDGLHVGEVNQALMELGATYCAPSGTGIEEEDPLRDFYQSTKLGAAYYAYLKQTPKPKDLQVAIQNAKATNCALCQSNGIAMVLEQLEEAVQDHHGEKNPYQAAQCSGHSVFPMAPPKQTKREEVLAVAVLSSTDANKENDDTYWLLVKRPKTGLLAGQWEFPSACVWNSDDDGNTKKGGKKRNSPGGKPGEIQVPTIAVAVRQKAVASLLDDMLSQDDNLRAEVTHKTLKKLKGPPLEHIFSHVRHTYAIEYGKITSDTNRSQELAWTSATRREVRWMRQSDMKQAGVTSGVLKILKAVQAEEQKARKRKGFFQPKKTK